MAGACLLAQHGLGQVHPNPLVGAVVLQGEEWVGKGWHAELGSDHAEVMALAEAGERARGATLVVTLEPCAHHGRTPPCVDAIIAAGIARVVIGAEDPNPVARGGAERLRAAGVEVVTGVLAAEVRRQNFRFFHLHRRTGRPWVTVKLAVSLDGCIADAAGGARWLSSEEARGWVHRVRAQYGAIGAGAVTVIADDARLTVRGSIAPRVPPTRVVFDRSGRLTGEEGIFRDAADVPVVVIRDPQVAPTGGLEDREGVRVLHAHTLEAALRELAGHGVDSILVEGGGRLAGALWREGLIDRVHQLVAPRWLGSGVPAWAGLGAPSLSDAPRWTLTEVRVMDGDAILTLERP